MMKIIRLAVIVNLILVFIVGCAGRNFKSLSGSDSTVTHQELIENWSEYNISFYDRTWFGINVIVFDPKNDDKKILVSSSWKTVKDQKAWTEFIKANTTSDGNFKLTSGRNTPTQTSETTGVLEILGPGNQRYGFFIRQERWDFVVARMVDENTLQLTWRPPSGGNPK